LRSRRVTYAAAPTDQAVVAALFSHSHELTIEHQITGEQLSFDQFFADLLFKTIFTLTPTLECSAENTVTFCAWTLSTSPKKENSEQVPTEDDSFYVLRFSYEQDATGNISIVDNHITYRIEQ
jgi:hypothetical protein